MKKYLLASLLLLSIFRLTAQDKKQKENETEKEPYTVKKFEGVKVNSVFSETSGGNITVTGDNGTTPRVEMYVLRQEWRKPISREEIKQKLEEYEVTIAISGNKITASARPLKNNNRNWREGINISFKIYVPQDVTTDLHSSGGNISLSNLTGTNEFKTSGGNLDKTKLSGTVKGRTSGGNVYLKNSKDNLDLGTSGGNIYAENCSGKIRIVTSGGDIEMTGLKGDIYASTSGGNVNGDHINGDLYAHTSGGNVRLKEISGGLDAATSGGNIDAAITDVTKSINISNSGGTIYLALPKNKGMDLRLAAGNIRTEPLPNFKGSQDKERIDGTVNGGGASVRVNANSGNIHLTWK